MDPVPARWPHATITIDLREYPALIIDWKRIESPGMYGHTAWHARCIYWDGEAPKVVLVPEMRVKRAG